MVDDALAQGIAHAGININLGQLVPAAATDPVLTFPCDGKEHRFARSYVESLDAQIRPFTAAGVVVSAILLAIRTGDPERDKLFVHSGCTAAAPNGMGAFATDTATGRAWLSAAIEFLAARYSGKDAPNGRIWNWIVGNEVNSHWWWYHFGRRDLPAVVEAYEDAVRLVHDAVARHSVEGRVFVSLEHHWTLRYAAGDEQQCVPGHDLLLAFAQRARERGDFAWHVAFHPYPENLFDCRFWADKTAPDADDAGRVTMKNLPVLLRFLARDELLCAGAVRHVILSEQGFHCRDDELGERDQAAAFALAWSIVQRLPGIDAFILHRHVDHAHEGGLQLGLWTRDKDSICTPGRRRRIAEVFAACDTARWPAVGEFALPVVGLKGFEEWPLGALPGKQ